MSNELATLSPDITASLVLNGDLKKLSPTQKVQYYDYRCRQAGLDPAAKPFDLLVLNGKEILYANAGGCQQLCSINKLSTAITHRELIEDIYCVSARVTGADGRATENMGTVYLGSAKGEALANAMMKATTKAIRRTVLCHSGLVMMEESEVDTIPNARKVDILNTSSEPVKNLGFSIQTPNGFPLFITDATTGQTRAFDYYPDQDAWIEAYTALVDRLANSQRITTPEGKIAARKSLDLANVDLLIKFEVLPVPKSHDMSVFDKAMEDLAKEETK